MKSIELLKDLSIQLGVVSVHDLKAYTIYELVTLISRRLNDIVLGVNQFGEDATEALKVMAEELDELLRGDKVEEEINKTLINWKEAGIFDELIKGSIFTNFENRLAEVEVEIPALVQSVNNKFKYCCKAHTCKYSAGICTTFFTCQKNLRTGSSFRIR